MHVQEIGPCKILAVFIQAGMGMEGNLYCLKLDRMPGELPSHIRGLTCVWSASALPPERVWLTSVRPPEFVWSVLARPPEWVWLTSAHPTERVWSASALPPERV